MELGWFRSGYVFGKRATSKLKPWADMEAICGEKLFLVHYIVFD